MTTNKDYLTLELATQLSKLIKRAPTSLEVATLLDTFDPEEIVLTKYITILQKINWMKERCQEK